MKRKHKKTLGDRRREQNFFASFQPHPFTFEGLWFPLLHSRNMSTRRDGKTEKSSCFSPEVATNRASRARKEEHQNLGACEEAPRAPWPTSLSTTGLLGSLLLDLLAQPLVITWLWLLDLGMLAEDIPAHGIGYESLRGMSTCQSFCLDRRKISSCLMSCSRPKKKWGCPNFSVVFWSYLGILGFPTGSALSSSTFPGRKLESVLKDLHK